MENIRYSRVSKWEARKLFNAGCKSTIAVLPVKLSPFNFWMRPISMKNTSDFDKFCNEVTYYNCCYETGYYLAFYRIMV